MIDLYWLAGIIEGEGCFTVSGGIGNPGSSPVISISMSDDDTIRKAYRIMGLTTKITIREKANKNSTKPMYMIQLVGRNAIGWMMTLYPIMSSRRQGRILEIITWWKSVPAWNTQPGKLAKQT